MATHRVRTLFALSLSFVLVAIGSGHARALVTPEPVISGAGDQWMPSANDEWVAYASWSRSSPNRYSAVAWNIADDTTTRLNAAGSNGDMGGFDPGTNTVLYAQ